MLKRNVKYWLPLMMIAVLCATGLAAGKKSVHSSGWESAPEKKSEKHSAQETPGSLDALDRDGNPAGSCPLKHTDVTASVSGFIARVTVTQRFTNPFKDKIEAVYTFPLPNDGAVDSMVMRIGDRTIRGLIKKREEARAIYEHAKQNGNAAALLDQERPNIFTQSVANILPGEDIVVKISYVETLKYEDGWYEFVFPMVVGPRYIPGNMATGQQGTGWSPDTDRVPDASRITPPVTPKGTRAGHDISIKVSIDAGVPINKIASKLHEINTVRSGKSKARVTLKDNKTIPNKDFILKYQVAGKDIADAILTHADKKRGGYFTLIVTPPARVPAKRIIPKEMIFVIDSSGSMSGWPIEKAKETMKHCINNMNPNDTFQLIAFSNNPRPLFDRPQPNTPENREKAMQFLGGSMGGGGTEMLKAVDAVLTPAPDPKRIRIAAFMTDGFVGNDMEILDYLKKYLGNTRFFSFGVGNGTNRFLLDEMARVGRGEVEYVTLESNGKAAAQKFYERIANPVLADIKIDWGGLRVSSVYPERVPDLYSNKPIIVKGRFAKGGGKGTITISGRAAGKRIVKKLRVSLPASAGGNSVLATLWARERIAEVMREDYYGTQLGRPRPDVKEIITGLGLEYNLVTQFTSFVAVDEVVVREGGKVRTVPVPVEMTDGVSYEGVFGDEQTSRRYATKSGVMAKTKTYALAAPAEPALSAQAETNVYSGGAAAPGKMVYDASSTREEIHAENEIVSVNGFAGESKEKKAKIAPELLGLDEKVKKQGKNGNLKLSGIEVKNWKTNVMIRLSDLSAANLKKLKEAGFVLTVESKAANAVIGKIDVRKLEKLAKFDFVIGIEKIQI